MTFFNPENTTARFVGWTGDDMKGFVVAALPMNARTGEIPCALIIVDPPDAMTLRRLSQVLRLACDTGAPRDELAVIYLFRSDEGRNEPVTRVFTQRGVDLTWFITSTSHPSHAEEDWVFEQVREAGAI